MSRRTPSVPQLDPLNEGDFGQFDATSNAVPDFPTGNNKPSHSNFFWILSFLLVLAIGIFVFLSWSKSTSPKPSSSPFTLNPIPTLTPSPTSTPSSRHHHTTLPPSEICLKMSDDFGVRPNNPASAEGVPSVLDAWEKNRCQTVPTIWSCQNISDAYNTSPTSTYQNPGYHIYKARGCTTSPSVTCQSISNTYNTRPGYWGDIAPDKMTDVQGDVLRDAWRNRHCQTIPDSLTCQDISNIYNMSSTSQGFAPPSIFGTFKSKGCLSTPMSCQYISDVYMVGGTDSGFVWGSSSDMNYADIAWENQKCSTEAPPTGYVTSLKNKTYTTGKTVYSSNKLSNCLQECITDTGCDLVEYNPVSKECTSKGGVDFDGQTKQTDGVVTYRKRISTS